MGASLKQAGFGGGIISPQALGRTDQQKYAVGLRECVNAWITRYGTIENRPGTIFCDTTKSPTAAVRAVPFVFSSDVSYLLEFGNYYVRVLKNGALVSVVGAAAYDAGTTYDQGDLVTDAGIVYYSLADGNVANTPVSSPLFWYPQTDGVLEIPTTIPQAALSVLQYVQQNDIMTLTAQTFAPVQLQRYSDLRWTLVAFTQSTGIDAPSGVAAVAGVAPAVTPAAPGSPAAVGGVVFPGAPDRYTIASFTAAQEGVSTAAFSTGFDQQATGGTPITLTWSAVGGVVGYAIFKQSAGAGPLGLVAIIPAGTLTWVDHGIATSPVAAAVAASPGTSGSSTTFTYVVTAIDATTGAESLASAEATCVGGTPTDAHPNSISWAAVANAANYRVYSIVAGVPGFIGQQPASPFLDTNFLPDTSIQPPAAISLFATSDDYPAVCGYFQQRILFANTINQPQTVWGSQIGNYYNFSVSTPIVDSDSFVFTIAGRQVQPITALVDLGKLIVHTANAEYVATADQAGAITPSTAGVVATGSAGSALMTPVVIGNTDLFVQQGATRLNDLRYEVQSFSFSGKDLTKLATNLFRGRTIVDLAWQKLPHSIVWCVLDNGQVVGLTYIHEDDIWAWHLHESTNGAVENVAVVPEGSDYTVYLVVRRVINGSTVRSIERLAPRDCIDSVFYTDSYFADSAQVYDGRNTGATTITASASAWTPTDVVTLTASVSTFLSGDVGNQIVLQQIDDVTGLVSDLVSFQILARDSATVARATPLRSVPTWAQATALTTWGKAVRDFSGISHLEGEDLAILADGNVAANPLDAKYPTITVASGAFSLTQPAMVVVAGLPLQTDVETLPVENATGETLANKRITVREVTPIFHESRGGSYGQDEDHLDAWKQVPSEAPAGYPTSSVTGPYRIPIRGTPQRTGQAWMRNTDPVPWGLSALVISGEIGS